MNDHVIAWRANQMIRLLELARTADRISKDSLKAAASFAAARMVEEQQFQRVA